MNSDQITVGPEGFRHRIWALMERGKIPVNVGQPSESDLLTFFRTPIALGLRQLAACSLILVTFQEGLISLSRNIITWLQHITHPFRLRPK